MLGFLLPFGPLVYSIPLLWLLWCPARASVSQPLGHPLPYQLVNVGLSDYKIKKIKKKKFHCWSYQLLMVIINHWYCKTITMVETILIINDNLIRFYRFSTVNGFTIGKAWIIIPIDIEIFSLLWPEKPPLYIVSAGGCSSII